MRVRTAEELRARDRAYKARNKERAAEQWRRWAEKNKEARAEYERQYRERNREMLREKRRKYVAANPDKISAYDAANRTARRQYFAARYQENREQMAEQSKAWKAANKELVREYGARRRARKRRAPVIEKIDRLALYERDGGKCHICGKRVPRDSFVLDHLVPLARGGEHTARNLRTAHHICNLRKGVDALPAQLLLIG